MSTIETSDISAPFTRDEAHFFTVMAGIDDLPPYPDEPDVNFVPCGRLKDMLWQAVQAIRREDAARGGWPASIHERSEESV